MRIIKNPKIEILPDRGKHCFIGRIKNDTYRIFDVINATELTKKWADNNWHWGDYPSETKPYHGWSGLYEATIIQNICWYYNLAPRIYEIVGIEYKGKKWFAQKIEDLTGKPYCNEHNDAFPLYEKVKELGKTYGFHTEKDDVSRKDVMGGKLVDFNTFHFEDDHREKVMNIIRDKGHYGKTIYQDEPKLDIISTPRKTQKRIEGMRLEEIDFKGKSVLDLGCFIKDTKILMANMTYKNIQDVNTGDMVINHLGKTDKIINTFNRSVDKIYSIDAGYGIKIDTTEEHPFLVDKEWIKAKELKVGDKVMIPRLKSKKDIKFDTDFAFILGLYLAEGSIMYSHKPHIGGICFTFHLDEMNLAYNVKKICLKNGAISVTIKKRPEKNITEVMVFGKQISTKIHNYCGSGCFNKKLTREVLDWNYKSIISLIKGWMAGDGYYKHTLKYGFVYSGTTSSEILANQLKILFHIIGVRPRFTKRLNRNKFRYDLTINNRDDISLFKNLKIINHTYNKKKYNTEDDYIKLPIRNIKIIENPTEVFNIEVEKEHSYLANDVCVHNCATGGFCRYAKDKGAKDVLGIDFEDVIGTDTRLASYLISWELGYFDIEFEQHDLREYKPKSADTVFFFSMAYHIGIPDWLGEITNEILIYEENSRGFKENPEIVKNTMKKLKTMFKKVKRIGQTEDREPQPVFWCKK